MPVHESDLLRFYRGGEDAVAAVRSLRLAGLEREAQELLAHLAALYRQRPAAIGAVTWDYWQRAANDPLPF